MSHDGEGYTGAHLIAVGLLVFGLSVVFVGTINGLAWRIEAVGHGYAHFDERSVWHWNNDAERKP